MNNIQLIELIKGGIVSKYRLTKLKMKKSKKILKLVITIILSILITIVILLNVSTTTILKEEYVLKKMEESNYYEMSYQEFQIAFDKYITQSGLRKTDSQEIFTKEQVKEDIQKTLQNIYEKTENQISTESIKEKTNINIHNQLEEETVTEHSEQAINQLIDTIGKDYENKIVQNLNGLNSLKQKEIAIRIIYIIIIVLIIVLIVVSAKMQKARAMLLIGTSMLVSGVILEFANIFINSKMVIEGTQSLTKSISTTVQLITNDILSKMLSQSIIIMVVGILAIIFGNVLYKKKIKQKAN